MTDERIGDPPGRALARDELRAVIRRAAELSVRDADAEESVTAAEMLRIGAELGLPEQHLLRALYELPQLTTEPAWYDRYTGSALHSFSRAVPGAAGRNLRRLEDYLVLQEYLQIVRRRSDSVALIPADDTLSSIARSMFRPRRRHYLSRADRLLVHARALTPESTHVQIEVDLSDMRRRSVNAGMGVGVLGGGLVGSVAALAASAVLTGPVADPAMVIAFGAAFLGTCAGSVSAAAARYRARAAAAATEIEHLLDRLERGISLNPPPAPWLRRLSRKLLGEPRG